MNGSHWIDAISTFLVDIANPNFRQRALETIYVQQRQAKQPGQGGQTTAKTDHTLLDILEGSFSWELEDIDSTSLRSRSVSLLS
jgi:hypothetical protein